MIVELAKEKQNDNDELAGVNICNKFYEVIIEFYWQGEVHCKGNESVSEQASIAAE